MTIAFTFRTYPLHHLILTALHGLDLQLSLPSNHINRLHERIRLHAVGQRSSAASDASISGPGWAERPPC